MNRVLRASSLVAIAVAAGLGVARAGPDGGPATLPIAGVVRDDQGRPIPKVWIEPVPRPGQASPRWHTDVHGRFQIDDVPRGAVKLLVTGWSYDAKEKMVETRAGVRDLVIVLDPGPQLILRIVGYVPGPVPEARGARVTWEEPDGKRDDRWAPIRDDGWVRFVALPPDREFELWADVEVNRRLVRARGLKPGGTERRVEAHEVKDIAGKVQASEALLEKTYPGNAVGPLRKHLTVDVYAHPQFLVAHTRVQDDGSFRLHGLPPGTYHLCVELFHGDFGHPPKCKRVEAGTTDVVIDLD